MNDENTCQTLRLAIVLSPEHRLALQLMAKDDKESMSTIVRGLILKEAKLRGLWPPDLQEKPDPAPPPPPDPTERSTLP